MARVYSVDNIHDLPAYVNLTLTTEREVAYAVEHNWWVPSLGRLYRNVGSVEYIQDFVQACGQHIEPDETGHAVY
jgi:hypothetical protein